MSSLKVTYSKAAPAVTVDTSVLAVPEWCSQYVIWAVLERCFLADTPVRSKGRAMFCRLMKDKAMKRATMASNMRVPRTDDTMGRLKETVQGDELYFNIPRDGVDFGV